MPMHAVDGGHGGVEQVGDLLGAPGQHVPEHQHGALRGGQPLQGRDEGQGHRLSSFRDRGRGRRRGRRRVQRVEQPVRVRLDRLQRGGGREPVQPVPRRSLLLVAVQEPPARTSTSCIASSASW